jgi:FO synthase
MHAVSRLVLHPLIPNIQTSWVKMGREGAALCLRAGANDLGGTLMYESITRAAGGSNGQLLADPEFQAIAAEVDRPLQQRNTLYRMPTEPGFGPSTETCLIPLHELSAFDQPRTIESGSESSLLKTSTR